MASISSNCAQASWKGTFFYTICLLSVLIILVIGCSDENLNPIPSEEEQFDELYATLFSPMAAETYQLVKTDSSSMELNVGAGVGDTVVFNIEGIPDTIITGADLLSAAARLQIRCERIRFVRGVDSTRSALVYDCRPDGITFSDSLLISVDSAYFNNNPNSNVVKLYFYNIPKQKWDLYSAVPKTPRRLHFCITHFSKYAISD